MMASVWRLASTASITACCPGRSSERPNTSRMTFVTRARPPLDFFGGRSGITSARGESWRQYEPNTRLYQDLRSHSILRGDLLRHFHVPVGNLPAKIVARQ